MYIFSSCFKGILKFKISDSIVPYATKIDSKLRIKCGQKFKVFHYCKTSATCNTCYWKWANKLQKKPMCKLFHR